MRQALIHSKAMKHIYMVLAYACAYMWLAGIQPLSAQTFPANGDTISIVYSYTSWRGTTDYYMAASSASAVSTGTTAASMDGLWQVVYESGSTTRFRLCNLNRGTWLRINPSGNTVFSLVSQSNSSVFTFDGTADAANQTAQYTLQYTNGTTTYYVYYSTGGWYGSGWRTSTYVTNASTLRIDRWTKRQTTSLTHTSVPQSMDFAWAMTEAEAAAQAQTVTYAITVIDSTYIYNMAGNSTTRLQQTVNEVHDPDKIEQMGYSLTWRWKRAKSTTEQDYSYLTEDLIENMDSDKYAEEPRDMMHYSGITKLNGTATSPSNWTLTVTPDGWSPFNLMAQSTSSTNKQYVDYEDELLLEIRKDGKVVAEKALTATRHAYHYMDVDDLTANLEPPTHYFPAQASETASLSKEFRLVLVHTQGLALLDAKGNFAEKDGVEIYNKTQTDTLTRYDINAENRKFTFLTADNQEEVTWLSWSLEGDKPFTITAQPNMGSTTRKALFVGSFYYENHHVVIHSTMFQRGSNEEGDRKFIAYAGISNSGLDDNGRQKVHQIETTIYYQSGEVVELRPNETSFRGYMRWYDYETGKAPQYTKDGTETSNFWAERPRFTYGTQVYDMTAINDDAIYSHGLYAYYNGDGGYMQTGRDFVPPTINAWTDQQERWIACDMSAYRDYQITDEAVQEPTLSTRQIFHLIPGERMADSIDALATGSAYEDYHYIAPTGKEVFLETRFAYYTNNGHVDHQSELCYFFWGKNGTRKQLRRLGVTSGTTTVNGVWYRRLPSETAFSAYTMNYNNDYATVSSATEGTVEYELRIPASATYSGKEVVLARFTVDYMDRTACGPSEQSGQAIISAQEIADNYNIMALQDFNFNTKPASTATEYLDRHLDWAESSYGYTYVPNKQYSDGTSLSYTRDVNNPFPYYGEYCITNRVGYDSYTNTWLDDTGQHGGAANGYCMYVDGAKRAGLVVSVSTDQAICSGQQLYCSAWICNPQSEGSNPIFRFNVQGRNKNADGTYTDWKDVGVFFAGELARQSGWRQVVFPLKSGNNYDESRVSIYNFATTNSGNDFLIDDVCLFASKLPLAAYQLMTTCQSDNHEAAVARIDYALMSDDWNCQPIYYDIYDATAGTVLDAKYYNAYGDQSLTNCGCIIVPETDYDPSKTGDATYRDNHTCGKDANEADMVYPTVSDFVDAIMREYDVANAGSDQIQEITMKGYIPTTENGVTRYVMYVGHIADKDMFNTTHTYRIRMAPTVAELSTPDCALTTELPIYDNTAISIDGQASPYRNACPNNTYEVTVRVTNTDHNGQVTQGTVYADWLLGYVSDSCYADRNSKPTEAQQAVADALFETHYGYSRGQIEEAMRDFRRVPEATAPNANYTATDFAQVSAEAFNDRTHYTIIRDLCNSGLLTLYRQSEDVFVEASDTVAYWLFPIQGTAQPDDPASTVTLNDCDDPQLLLIIPREKTTDYLLNLSPVRRADMTDVQRALVPNVRVSASQANVSFTVPVSDIENVSLGWDSCQVVSTTDPLIAAKIGRPSFSMHYTQDLIWSLIRDNDKYYHAGSNITFTPVDTAHVAAMKALHDANTDTYHDYQPGLWRANTDTMRAGYEYTMRVQLLDRSSSQIWDSDRSCLVGYAFFNVIVVPDTMQWTPTVSNEWGDDRNWRAIVGGQLLDYGYAPLAETMVIIPQLADGSDLYPVITDNNPYPMDAHYTSRTCRKIHFDPLTRLLNQHLLTYQEAYVDLCLPQADWYSVAAPLQNMYSGDFFIPHTGDLNSGTNTESDAPFTVKSFEGARSRDAAYAFWLSYYNRTVSMLHSTGSSTTLTGTATFSESNAMNEPLLPCSGFNVLGFGPDNIGVGTDLVIRLPKPDDTYYYFDDKGNITTDGVSLTRTNAHRLAYPLNSDYTFTLTNTQADTTFLFGNPTMAYIDMQQFLADNTHLRNWFQYIDRSAWRTVSLSTASNNPSARFVAPMQSVKLSAATADQSLTVTLRPEHLTLSPAEAATAASAPHRDAPARVSGHAVRSEVMDITAYNGRGRAFATLAKIDFADNRYDPDEDVPFISSGVEAGVNGNTATTPVNLYTVAGTQALMADIRAGIGVVPVGFLISDEPDYTGKPAYRTDSVTLAFRLSADWDTECYLCDAATGDRWLISNDTHIRIATPANHELRYYIQGPDKAPDTPTDLNPSQPDDIASAAFDGSVYAFSSTSQQATIVATSDIAEISAFDLAGRQLHHIALTRRQNSTAPIYTMPLPAGIALLQVRLLSGYTAQIKVVVKE